jgi:translation initiation factor 3 subunit C
LQPISTHLTTKASVNMSSRFFKASDSSESDSDEQELYSEEEAQPGAALAEESSEEDSDDDNDDDSSDDDSSSDDGVSGPARFLKAADGDDSSDSESDEDKVTVVKSAKDKRFEEAEGVVKVIDNAVKIDDWAVISTEFDKLGRLMPNLVKILDGKYPKFYIKVLADLNTSSSESYEKLKASGKKAGAADKQRGLNAVRQKVRRMVKEAPYAADVEKYQANADAFMKEETTEAVVATKPKPKKVTIDVADTGLDDNEGFETVGRDGKVLAFTPESILKSKLYDCL